MNPEDDPEARIRQLEQPLARSGRELGATEQPVADTSALPPPVYDYPPDQSPYAAPPFGVSYPRAGRSGTPFGLIMGLIAAVVVLLIAGIGFVVWLASTDTAGRPTVVGGSFDEPPSIPLIAVPTWTMPEMPSVVTEGPPTVAVAPAGGSYSIAGVENVETVECNGSDISISGVNNTVTLIGHCLSVNVSGIENHVVVDSVATIQASGFNNEVIYHEGDPEINATAQNSVSRG